MRDTFDNQMNYPPEMMNVILVGGPRHGEYRDIPSDWDCIHFPEPISRMVVPLEFDGDHSERSVFKTITYQRNPYYPSEYHYVETE